MESPQSDHSPVSSRRSFLALTGATAAGSLAAFAGFLLSPPLRRNRAGPPLTPG